MEITIRDVLGGEIPAEDYQDALRQLGDLPPGEYTIRHRCADAEMVDTVRVEHVWRRGSSRELEVLVRITERQMLLGPGVRVIGGEGRADG